MAKEKFDYEASVERLEEIVARLESGSVPLADMMKLYEEGEALHKKLDEVLTSYEKRISSEEDKTL